MIWRKHNPKQYVVDAESDLAEIHRPRTGSLAFAVAERTAWVFNGSSWAPAGAGGASSADAVSYDPTASGLDATDVQGALDELAVAPGTHPGFILFASSGNPANLHAPGGLSPITWTSEDLDPANLVSGFPFDTVTLPTSMPGWWELSYDVNYNQPASGAHGTFRALRGWNTNTYIDTPDPISSLFTLEGSDLFYFDNSEDWVNTFQLRIQHDCDESIQAGGALTCVYVGPASLA